MTLCHAIITDQRIPSDPVSATPAISPAGARRWGPPRKQRSSPTRRFTVAATLILVIALHGLFWRLLDTPEQATAIRHTQPDHQTLVVSMIAPSHPRAAPKMAAGGHAAETGQSSQRPPQPRRTAPPKPARVSPSTTDYIDEPPPSAPSAATGPALDGQRTQGDPGAVRSYRYGSNAERATAAMSAGSAVLSPAPAQGEFERQTARAAKADCRKAHASMGLLALPMLAYDALNDSGCRW